jgi:hypothetical protein
VLLFDNYYLVILFFLLGFISKMKTARTVERRGAYRDLVGNPEGRRPLGRPRRRWEDNI